MWLRAPGTKDVGASCPMGRSPLGGGEWGLNPHFLLLLGFCMEAQWLVCTKYALVGLCPRQREHICWRGKSGVYTGHVCECRIAGLYPGEVRMHLFICVWLIETSPVVHWLGESPPLGPVKVWWKGSLWGLGGLLVFLSGGDAGEVAKGHDHFIASAGSNQLC